MIIHTTGIYERWLNKLKDTKARQRIDVRLHRLETQDYLGDVKSLGDKLFEIRVNYGPGYRIYYTYRGDEIVLLLVGGDKGSQAADIKMARSLIKGI